MALSQCIMAKTSGELEKEFIVRATILTGRSVPTWMQAIRASGWSKRNEILNGLKKDHGLGHLHAQFLAGMYLNNGNPVYVDEGVLLDAHFVNCPDMRPVVQATIKVLLSRFAGARLIPRKTYLSITDVREFAAIKVKANEIRLGLDLGAEPFVGPLRKAVLAGPMPRFSHMLVLGSHQQVNEQVISFVKKSYERSHKK